MRTHAWFILLLSHIGTVDTLISCDFEDGLCDWSDVSATKYNWTTSSRSSHEYTSGPLYDHTFTDDFGHYLFTHGARASRSAVAVLRSKEIIITSTVNLTFWYHMNGIGIGNLSLVREEKNGSTTLWSKHGRQGIEWLQAVVALRPGIFRLRFETTVNSPHSSDIALDDVRLATEPKVFRTRPTLIPTTPTTTATSTTAVPPAPAAPATTFSTSPNFTCPVHESGSTLPGSCDFEVSKMCGYTSTETTSVQWLRHKGYKGSIFGAHITGDHGTGKGFYVYLRTDGNDKNGMKATLTSPELTKETRICVQFAYIIIPEPEVTLNVYAVTSGSRVPLATITDHKMTSWKIYNITHCAEKDTRIQFEAAKEDYLGFVGLDDINVTSGHCGQQYISNVSSSVTLDINYKSSSAKNTAHRTLESHTTLSTSRTAKPITTKKYATSLSHSTVSSGLQIASQKPSAIVSTPSHPLTSVKIVESTSQTNVRMSNSPPVSEQPITESVDNIFSCDFEDGSCDWSDVSASKYDWKIRSGPSQDFTSGPQNDHTFKDHFGHYMLAKGGKGTMNSVAVLKSKIVKVTETVNLTFWYHMNGNGVGNLSLSREENHASRTLWERQGRQGMEWLQAELEMQPGTFRLRFEATVSRPYGSDIALDDIRLTSEPTILRTRPTTTPTTTAVTTTTATSSFPTHPPLTCPVHDPGVTLQGSCNFEVSKMCGYTSTETSSVQWLRHKGYQGSLFGTHITGDHGTGKGYYVYLRTDGNSANGQKASLTSPSLNRQTRVCLQFAYIIVSKPEVTLKVYTVTSGSREPLTVITAHGMTSWQVYNISLCAERDKRIEFEAEKRDYLGFVGLDDIQITSGRCGEIYTVDTTRRSHDISTESTHSYMKISSLTIVPASSQSVQSTSRTTSSEKSASSKYPITIERTVPHMSSLPESSHSMKSTPTTTIRDTKTSGLSSKYPITMERTGSSLRSHVMSNEVYTTTHISSSAVDITASSHARQLPGGQDYSSTMAATTAQNETSFITTTASVSKTSINSTAQTTTPAIQTGPTAPSTGTQERNDLDCSGGRMRIHVPQTLLPTHIVTLRDPSCKVASNGSHLLADVGVNECGTTVSFTNDSVIFTNELVATALSGTTAPTIIDYGMNMKDQRVKISCIYPRENRIDFSYVPVMKEAHFYERQYGKLSFDVSQYSDEQFSHAIPHNGLPIGVTLNTELFIDISLRHASHKGVGIMVDSCIATPTSSPADPLWYTVIKDGCPAQQDVRTFASPDVDEFRFSFLVFRFTQAPLQKAGPNLPPTSMVFIHCQVSACPSQNCTNTCNPAGSHRVRREAELENSHLVSAGPFYLKSEEERGGYNGGVVAASVSMAVVATLVAIVALVAWRRSVNKLSKHQTLDEAS